MSRRRRKIAAGVQTHAGFGSEICAQIVESEADYLDAPVERITGADIPTPYAKVLEDLAFPDVPLIVKVIKRSLYRA